MMRTSSVPTIVLVLVILARLRCEAAPTMMPSEEPAPLGQAWVVAQPIQSERLPSPTDFDSSDKQDSFKNWDLFSKLSSIKHASEIKDWSVVYDPKTRLVGFISGSGGYYAAAIERVATAPPPGIARADLSHVVTTLGLHIGSSLADVEAVFGKPLDWIEYKNRLYGAADYRHLGDCPYDSIFILRDDVVEGILFSAGC